MSLTNSSSMNQAFINVAMMHAHRNNPTQQQNTANTMIAIVPITKFIFSIPHSNQSFARMKDNNLFGLYIAGCKRDN